MKWLATSFFTLFFFVVFSPTVFPQTEPSKAANNEIKWIRVVSDDGEFSIEVPEKYIYFFDQDGFSVASGGSNSNYSVKQVRLLRSFLNGTFISFECHEADKGALSVMLDEDNYPKAKKAKSEFKKENYSIKQLISTTKDSYTIRQSFYSKKNIYILTAASRTGETVFMRRFLDSLKFTPNIRSEYGKDTIKFSSLSVTKPEYEVNPSDAYPSPNAAKKPDLPKDSDAKMLVLLSKPHPSFTDTARQTGVTGNVVVRVTFSDEGYISKVVALRGLPGGLMRQVWFAANRINFLPPERKGKVESVSKHIEYFFGIY